VFLKTMPLRFYQKLSFLQADQGAVIVTVTVTVGAGGSIEPGSSVRM